MNYWLHRIGHLQNVSYPLLEKGYISIGFSDFCTENFYKKVVLDQDWSFMEKQFEECWGNIPRNRYSLWRFLNDFKQKDYVVVPSWGTFSVYEICDDLPIMVTDTTIDIPETDWNGTKIHRNNKTKFLKLENEKDDLDIGFLRKVKPVCIDIPRSDYADAAFTSRMKIQSTNADISDLEKSIKKAIKSYKNKQPINLKADILEKSIDCWNNIILEELNPDKYEKLIRWYFRKIGATESYIPPKNIKDKAGDVDVIATFENLRTIVNVQVKFYKGETSDWAINQINDFAKSKENMSDGYNRQYWVISSSDSFSEESYNLAKENNILLIDGKQFVSMLLNVGLETMEAFEE